MFLTDQELSKDLPTCKTYSTSTMPNQGLYFAYDVNP